MGTVHKKLGAVAGELLALLKVFDTQGKGFVSKHDLLAGCAGMGVVLSETEMGTLQPMMTMNAEGQVDYTAFCNMFK